MIDYSPEAMTAQADALRGALAIEGDPCPVCTIRRPVSGEELCSECTTAETADINHEIKERLHAA